MTRSADVWLIHLNSSFNIFNDLFYELYIIIY